MCDPVVEECPLMQCHWIQSTQMCRSVYSIVMAMIDCAFVSQLLSHPLTATLTFVATAYVLHFVLQSFTLFTPLLFVFAQ